MELKNFLPAILLIIVSILALADESSPVIPDPLIPFASCSVIDQGGSVDALCGAKTPIRCYADVDFGSSKGQVYGDKCWASLADCFSTGAGAVNPCNW